MSRVVVVDNRDSFVYNLVDTLAATHETVVVRNTVSVDEVFALEPDLIVTSPGPGHPREAGCLMDVIARADAAQVPLLGICLGFQALLEYHGGTVAACGPVHGVTDDMVLTDAGAASPLFAGLADPATGRHVPVARYHSLGTTEMPEGMTALGYCRSEAGPVVMAGESAYAIGLQFHPESLLSPDGPVLLNRCVARLAGGTAPGKAHGAGQDAGHDGGGDATGDGD